MLAEFSQLVIAHLLMAMLTGLFAHDGQKGKQGYRYDQYQHSGVKDLVFCAGNEHGKGCDNNRSQEQAPLFAPGISSDDDRTCKNKVKGQS